jgi:hypothetical protein
VHHRQARLSDLRKHLYDFANFLEIWWQIHIIIILSWVGSLKGKRNIIYYTSCSYGHPVIICKRYILTALPHVLIYIYRVWFGKACSGKMDVFIYISLEIAVLFIFYEHVLAFNASECSVIAVESN